MNNKSYSCNVQNLECASCAKKIEDKINKTEGFEDANLNFNTTKLTYKSALHNHKEIINKIAKSIEPDVKIVDDNIKNDFKINKTNLVVLVLGILLGLSTIIFNFSDKLSNIIIIISYVLLLTKVAIKAIKILIRNKSLDENILITISVIGAYLIGDAFEGFMVIGLYSIGKVLEEMAVNKSKKEVSKLMDIKPEFANLKKKNTITTKNPNEIKIGDIIVVKVGEKIPLDGKIVDGKTSLDTKALTGESKPIIKSIGDEVLSGSINLTEKIEIKVTKIYQDSTVNQILELVQNATNRKSKTENFVTRAARIYTPIIIVLSLLTAFLLPLIPSITNAEAVYRALSFLVISCPCAIAISVPLSYFSGIGLASRKGILFKGSNYLDNIRNIKTIIFDKTGTITTGNFKVTEVRSLNKKYSKEQIIELSAIGESFSNHPIAKSILKYYGKKVDHKNVKNHKEIAGVGISFNLNNDLVEIKNSEKKEGITGTILYLKINSENIGIITLNDEIKVTAKDTIKKLQEMNIKTIMFTGDNESVAKEIASVVGIDYKAKLLPQDKYNELNNLLKENKNPNYKVAFVGDGINDAPVLTLADIGISMGSIGSSSAIEASDIVIMNDQLDKIVEGIKVSKITTKIIKQNLIFSIGIKLIFILLNLFGFSTMALAVFADVGVTVLAILNSIRILKH